MSNARPQRARRPVRDPLVGVQRLVVDVNNVLGALPRARTRLTAAGLLGHLRALVPPGGSVELIFDGPPARGAGRPGPGIVARYAAPRSADELIVDLVRAAGVPAPGVDPPILVVTDDAELRRSVRDLGGATVATAWLIDRAGRLAEGAPSVARKPAPHPTGEEPDEEGGHWRPGRGATTKRGNPKRSPKRSPKRGTGA